MSRYLFLIIGEPDHYDRWDAASEDEQQEVLDHYRAFTHAVNERGRMVAGEALARPSEGFAVPASRSRRLVVDGPYAETAEQLAGFYLADLPDRATAVELAQLLPAGQNIEVRHCPDVGATPRNA